MEFRFVLSQGLFSSADIDRGTRLLLKVFSRLLDEDVPGKDTPDKDLPDGNRRPGRPPPRRVLDSGCGVGVIGVCAARALLSGGKGAAAGPLLVRAQDRDELARIFTRGNALRNGLGGAVFEARAEPLLAGDGTWDLILSNVPAKAGAPVLEDFVSRSVGLLAPGGRAIVVIVNSLAGFFRARLEACTGGRGLIREEAGTEHRVFVYERPPAPETPGPESAPAGLREGAAPENAAPGAPAGRGGGPEELLWRTRPFYLRNRTRYETRGIAYEIGAVHGAAEFDRPGPAADTAAALFCRPGGGPGAGLLAGLLAPALIHEGGQGHFPLWLLLFLERNRAAAPELLLLHGRNVLALEAARGNIAGSPLAARPAVLTVPGVDLGLDRDLLAALSRPPDAPRTAPDGALRAGPDGASRVPAPGFGFIAAFPRIVPRTEPYDGLWEALGTLLLPGAAALFSLPAAQAERLDRRKAPGFIRLGDLKRRGFRALLYRRPGP
jgi:SAM-dependent methyltransferase